MRRPPRSTWTGGARPRRPPPGGGGGAASSTRSPTPSPAGPPGPPAPTASRWYPPGHYDAVVPTDDQPVRRAAELWSPPPSGTGPGPNALAFSGFLASSGFEAVHWLTGQRSEGGPGPADLTADD